MNMKVTSIVPLGDRVLVKQDDEPQMSAGGIYLPDTAKEAPQFATVIHPGLGGLLENGERRKPSVKEGDKVIFGKYSGTKVKLDDEEYLFLREEDILGVVQK